MDVILMYLVHAQVCIVCQHLMPHLGKECCLYMTHMVTYMCVHVHYCITLIASVVLLMCFRYSCHSTEALEKYYALNSDDTVVHMHAHILVDVTSVCEAHAV